ncbi:MAG: CehA/McbA family metallohydrolase [Bryobacterales bacterium]|nr:CehA/McbA family metallohydrolase [Bryobacterales bacterium]
MRRALISLTVLALLAGIVAYRHVSAAAAESDPSTWGASDPSWSPDSKQIAFTLFGSIWTVDPTGGDARQITSSPGYHAHPSWSPNGDFIAFISGAAPAGRLPNIGGRLKLVQLSTGEERDVATPYPTAGTIAWSPDSERLVVALRIPNQGAFLHEIPIRGGNARQLQAMPQRQGVGDWLDASYARDGREIFFAGIRRESAQIWSIPSGSPPVFVQLPLTAYRPSDIVQLHSLSAVPTGEVVYSAVLTNGKGDYELYRVPRAGGTPLNLTNSPRDEFSPAVSPDGKSIAHVSNHLGNLDLFVMPSTGGPKRHIKIGKLQFRAPSGRVRVKTVDENGNPVPVRLYVIAPDGKAYAPQGAPVYYYPLDPGAVREGFYLSSGEDEFSAPAGRLRLAALKGVEYRIADSTVDVPPNDIATVTIRLERWTNWAVRGWFTGENHFHANYNGSYYLKPKDALAWLEAEDLNTANMIVANSEGAFVHDKEFFRGAVDPASKPNYVLYWSQEYRNSSPLGHMAFLNLKRQVPPSFTSVTGSRSPYDYPLNTMAALAAKQQGGLVSYVHPVTQQFGDPFDTSLGAKEAPLTAALGAMDAIDILPYGPRAYEMWYRLLNSGFRIAPGAGTDVFTNWRGINSVPGGARQYVELNGPMEWKRWLSRYKEGRAFVTNAPLLSFQVNGKPMGSVIEVPQGQPYTARISAEVASRVPIDLLEIIHNGQVIASTAGPRIDKEIALSSSSWLAVRVSGPPARGVPYSVPRAHSAPIYIHIGGKPVLIREDIELLSRWTRRLWLLLEERNNFGSPANKAAARAMFDKGLAHYTLKLAATAETGRP